MRHFFLIALCTICFTGCEKQTSTPPPQPNVSAATVSTPTAEIRAYLIAILSNDEAEIRKCILPNPDASILWQGQAPPPDVLSEMQTRLDTMTVRECVVGEIVDLPGGQQMAVTDQLVNANQMLVYPVIEGEAMPTPLSLVRIEDQWKVDAAPLIASRQAVNRMRSGN